MPSGPEACVFMVCVHTHGAKGTLSSFCHYVPSPVLVASMFYPLPNSISTITLGERYLKDCFIDKKPRLRGWK